MQEDQEHAQRPFVEQLDRLVQLRHPQVRLHVLEEPEEEALEGSPPLVLLRLEHARHEVAVGDELEPGEGEGGEEAGLEGLEHVSQAEDHGLGHDLAHVHQQPQQQPVERPLVERRLPLRMLHVHGLDHRGHQLVEEGLLGEACAAVPLLQVPQQHAHQPAQRVHLRVPSTRRCARLRGGGVGALDAEVDGDAEEAVRDLVPLQPPLLQQLGDQLEHSSLVGALPQGHPLV
mmetsp:Transcript_58172/g.136859  ORF Transcript_58172/g.136859 Transcript_58172/m.136859 type:complete len:231 (-) Transcript_58172:1787-2479(-)